MFSDESLDQLGDHARPAFAADRGFTVPELYLCAGVDPLRRLAGFRRAARDPIGSERFHGFPSRDLGGEEHCEKVAAALVFGGALFGGHGGATCSFGALCFGSLTGAADSVQAANLDGVSASDSDFGADASESLFPAVEGLRAVPHIVSADLDVNQARGQLGNCSDEPTAGVNDERALREVVEFCDAADGVVGVLGVHRVSSSCC